MSGRTSRLLTRLAQLLLGAWLGCGLAGSLLPNAPAVVVGLGQDLKTLLAVLVLSVALGVPLGALAGSGPKWLDATLAFMTDWTGAVPVVLLLAFVRPAGVSHVGGLLLLGALRALEVGWVVRSALLRAARLDTTWAARSLGYMPLSVFVNQRLPAAARPALAHLALTPVWTFLLDSIGTAAGLGAASSPRSLGAWVVTSADGSGTAVAVLAVVSATWALHRLGEHYGLRIARK